MRTFKRLLVTLLVLLIFAAAVLAVFYFHFDKEQKEITEETRKTTPGSYIELSHGFTHYELDGQDSGKVVVLIHGFSVPYHIWDGTYEYLLEHGFRVLRYDQYGRGYSDRPNVVYNRQLYYDQLKELITKLHLKQPVSLVGISFGGKLAADFTGVYPGMVNKVVLIDPAYPDMKPKYPAVVTNYHETVFADDRANGQLSDFKYPDRQPTWVEKYLPQMSYKGFRHALVSTMYNYDLKSRPSYTQLNSQHKQVLLIWGKEDKTVPFNYSDSVRSVLKTEFLPVDNAGHLPYLDQPDIVNPALVTFLNN
ncbi:alpha/beta hydrolase [Inquilinus sp. KBS0705]|nr:alpha/beta hydrolase [Inquilinus sp. KBS0705]